MMFDDLHVSTEIIEKKKEMTKYVGTNKVNILIS